MISFEKASAILNQSVRTFGTERVPLGNSLNRVLAEDIFSDEDIPPFRKSLMDGFACRRKDLQAPLRITADIPAGTSPPGELGENECMRIMTGGMVPLGADCVIKKEDTELLKNGLVRCRNTGADSNISPMGEDFKTGELALQSGCLLGAPQVAVMAALGKGHPMVYHQPTVAVISTGNELVDPLNKPGISQIRDGNGYQLRAQAMQMGLRAEYLGIARDDKTLLASMLAPALERYPLVLISGGVSVGELDYVPGVIKDLGVDIRFHRVQVKPGKHMLFGVKGDHFIFGFPGNPVSSFVLFEILVKPFIMRCMGYRGSTEIHTMTLAETFRHSSPELMLFIPVDYDVNGSVKPVTYHGSAHIHAYTMAKGIMEVPAGILEIKKGEKVHVRPL